MTLDATNTPNPLEFSWIAIGWGYGMLDHSAQFAVCHNAGNGSVYFHEHDAIGWW